LLRIVEALKGNPKRVFADILTGWANSCLRVIVEEFWQR